MAEFILVDLDLSKTTIQFNFKDDSSNMTTIEILTIKNFGNSKATYKFVTDPNSAFSVKEQLGVIDENSSNEI